MGLSIGVTGGIGSGKSVVCRIFKILQIPVFDADAAAKTIMTDDLVLKEGLIDTFGEQTYFPDGTLNRQYLAQTVFGDEQNLKKLNALVHPAVIRAGEEWAIRQQTPYNIKEAALLFESGSYKKLDYTILVTAPESVRIARVMERDGLNEQQVLERMSKQFSDEEKLSLADFVVVNDGSKSLIQQVMELHEHFLSL